LQSTTFDTMKTLLKLLTAMAATYAVFTIVWAVNWQLLADHSAQPPRGSFALEFILSVILLHWLFDRYATGWGLLEKSEHRRLIAAAENGYHRSALRGSIGVGYLCLMAYAQELWGPGHLPSPLPFGLGYCLAGFVGLLIGEIVRARGVIAYLLKPPSEPAPTAG
jgi:hypothetical protein